MAVSDVADRLPAPTSGLPFTWVGNAPVSVGTPSEVLAGVIALARDTRAVSLVVTPNTHHVSLLKHDQAFRRAYHTAELWPADGWPVAYAATLSSGRTVRRAPGSNMAFELADHCADGTMTLAIVGGSKGAAEKAAQNLRARHPNINIVLTDPAPYELQTSPELRAELVERISAAAPHIVLLGMGAPKQENFASTYLMGVSAGAIVCVGAGIDFLAGAQKRAPEIVQRVGMEWAFRLVNEPGRLAKRYAVAAWDFGRILTPLLWRHRDRLTAKSRGN